MPTSHDLETAFAALTFCADRTPEGGLPTSAATKLQSYRDGGVFVVHYAGNSEWERHGQGDEIVWVHDGATTLFLLDGETETAHPLTAGQLMVVPQNTWHRFETPDGARIMTVTPQPTDHTTDKPENPS